MIAFQVEVFFCLQQNVSWVKNVVFASSVQCSKEIVRENENLSRYFILYFTAILYNQLCSGITYAYKSTKDLSMTS